LPNDRERFLEAGFDHYLSKPFTAKQLLSTIKEALHKHAIPKA
jgi:CheY-like chemotaxis protein